MSDLQKVEEDARIVAKLIAIRSYQDFEEDAKMIQQYAETYAARRCHTCPKLKNALDTHTRDRDAEIENIAEKE